MYSTNRPRTFSFLFGLLAVLPGCRALDRLIRLEAHQKSKGNLTSCFAIGHMIVSYSLLLLAGAGVFHLMDGPLF